MRVRENDIDRLLQARSEIDEALRRHKTKQTVLFTDIVGSTTYFDRYGDTEGLLLLYQHDALVKGTVEEFSGIVVKTIGDSVMAEFADPLPAVLAAIAIQRQLLHHNQSLSRSERLQIRIGIHTGFGFKRANDLFGDIVNVAARITKRSGPAQILVSHAVMESIPSTDVFFKSLGQINLDGKSEPEELFEAYWTDAKEYDAIRSTFPTSSTSTDVVSLRAQIGNSVARWLRMYAVRAYYEIRLWSRRFVSTLHATRGMAAVKTAMVVALYLAIAAGMVSGRADTKLPAIPDKTPAPPAAETPSAEPPPAVADENAISDKTDPIATALPEATPIPERVENLPEPAIARVFGPFMIERRPSWMALIETVSIPAGTFWMGDETGRGDEKPRHQVILDRFNMGRTEITNRQYLAFLADSGHQRPKEPSYAKNYLTEYPNLPVVNVSYDDALAFCAWASQKFKADVRLPTEAEWEYAAVAGENGVPFPWGPLDPKTSARFKGNAPLGVRTASMDAFPPNRYGLYNMSGNVWEWVLDYYSKDYYETSPIRNPKGPPAGTKHSIRGGSWANDDSTLRVTRRASRNPDEHSDQIGFRVVITPSH